MADLNLRINRDVLTIAANARAELAAGGLDVEKNGPMTLAIEPEVVEDALMNDVRTGAQCVVTNVINFAPAALRLTNSLDKAEDLAKTSVKMLAGQRVQHPLVRIVPCGLPIDEGSKQSLNEHADQYKFIGRLFGKLDVDGFLLDDFENATELKCALIGLRMVTDKTLIYFKDNLENTNIIDEDYAPASSKLAIFDYNDCAHIDELLDRATRAAQSGKQFLLIKNASTSKTAAIAAITTGLPVAL